MPPRRPTSIARSRKRLASPSPTSRRTRRRKVAPQSEPRPLRRNKRGTHSEPSPLFKSRAENVFQGGRLAGRSSQHGSLERKRTRRTPQTTPRPQRRDRTKIKNSPKFPVQEGEEESELDETEEPEFDLRGVETVEDYQEHIESDFPTTDVKHSMRETSAETPKSDIAPDKMLVREIKHTLDNFGVKYPQSGKRSEYVKILKKTLRDKATKAEIDSIRRNLNEFKYEDSSPEKSSAYSSHVTGYAARTAATIWEIPSAMILKIWHAVVMFQSYAILCAKALARRAWETRLVLYMICRITFIVAIVLAITGLVFQLGLKANVPVRFCDSGASPRNTLACLQCPVNGLCSNGIFRECEEGYMKYSSMGLFFKCKLHPMTKRMKTFLVNTVDSAAAAYECDGARSQEISTTELMRKFENRFVQKIEGTGIRNLRNFGEKLMRKIISDEASGIHAKGWGYVSEKGYRKHSVSCTIKRCISSVIWHSSKYISENWFWAAPSLILAFWIIRKQWRAMTIENLVNRIRDELANAKDPNGGYRPVPVVYLRSELWCRGNPLIFEEAVERLRQLYPMVRDSEALFDGCQRRSLTWYRPNSPQRGSSRFP